MNAERLHAIARAVRDDLRATEAASLVGQLAQALRAQNQQEAAASRTQLEERLSQAPSNSFSPAWKQSVEELEVADLLGEGLLARVTEILQRHEITPVAAADELDPLGGLLLQLETMLDQLFAGLEFFHIGAEELAPGDFEVGFLLPRGAVDNELEKLGKEFAELDRRLGVFQELGTGTRADLEIRSISSSGFQVFLVALPGFALVMSKVLESLLTSYQKILDIRETHERLKKDDVPAERIQPLLDFANEKMALDIEALTGALIDEFGDRLPDAGRANELRLEITHSLNVLANRIDEGYSIEVRAGELPSAEEGQAPEGVTQEAAEAAEIIGERQPRMRFLNLTGRRILELPESDAGDGGNEVE